MSKGFQIIEVLHHGTRKIYEEEQTSGYTYTAILDVLDENDLYCLESEFDDESYYLELSFNQFNEALKFLNSLDTQEIQELSVDWEIQYNEIDYTKKVIIQNIEEQLKEGRESNLIFNIF